MDVKLPVLLFAVVAVTAPGPARAQSPLSTDEARSGWQYRRVVTLKEQAGLVALPLPPEVRARSASGQSPLADLRLVEAEGGREVPYVVEEQTPSREDRSYQGTVDDVHHDRNVQTVWLIDLKKQRAFSSFSIEIAQNDFVKRLKIEAAPSRTGPFQTIAGDVGVFDRTWPYWGVWRLHHTDVELPAPVSARFLRITADDRLWSPVVITGVTVHGQRVVPGVRWSRPVGLVPVASPSETAPAGKGKAPRHESSQYTLQLPADLPAGVPIEDIEIVADEPVFARKVTVLERGAAASESSESMAAKLVPLGEGMVYRFFPFVTAPPRKKGEELVAPTGDDAIPFEWRQVHLSRRPSTGASTGPAGIGAGSLVVTIENGDSPPLRGLRAVISGTATRLVFPQTGVKTSGLVLYYGNPRARAPQYDLDSLKGRMMGLDGLPLAMLSAEEKNPRFRPLPPLSFVTGLGAELEVQGFRAMRTLRFDSNAAEDIYGFSLQAEDLGILRSDYGDLRIVDGHDRQVPYVLSDGESERSLTMEPRPVPASRPKDQARRLTRFELHVASSLKTAAELSLPVAAIDIEVKDAFFTRPVRVLMPAAAAAPPGEQGSGSSDERELWSGQLSRRVPGDGSDGTGPEEAAEPAVLRIVLPSGAGPYRTLAVEIDNQDNAPLSIAQMSAVVVVPRVAFKLKPEGEYRVMYGARESAPPHYDIELLRRAVLDYAATPVALDALRENAAYRVRVGDYLREAPPTVVIWSSLAIGIVVLLGLTVRLLRKPDEA